jgi:homoserine O-acetyltransferase
MKPLLWLLAAPLLAASGGTQQFFTISEFPLESGAVIRDCRIGYRTWGKLAPDKGNAILFPTWFTGSSKDLEPFVGTTPNRMLDTAKYFVIAVDALANGVSSSPSNSPTQPRLAFPKVTIRDMVNSQRRLIAEVFASSGCTP